MSDVLPLLLQIIGVDRQLLHITNKPIRQPGDAQALSSSPAKTRVVKKPKRLTPRLWESQKAVVARSKPMEKEKAAIKVVATKTEFRRKKVL